MNFLSRSSCLLLLSVLGTIRSSTVPVPPSIKVQPPYEQLYQVAQTTDETDKPFTLDCEAEGNPEPTYRWKKNGLDFDYVAYDKRISQQPRRGTLVFTKPEDVDEGLYQCFAENVHGTAVSNAVFLRKSELNSFAEEDSREIYVMEGDPVTLDCNPPTGYPKPTIFWIIQSSSGALRSINSSRITVDIEGDLHFSNATREDALDDATYACSATSMFRNEYKLGNKITLRVEPSGGSGQASHPPTKQYLSPPNIVALRGQKLDLSCIFGGTPLPDIVWKKKGSNLFTNRFTYTNYGKTLQIKKVDFQDESTYECTASNGVGTPLSHAMAVTVQSAPYWVNAPNDTNAAEDEDVSFTCEASGVPEPRLQWFVNGIPIEKAPQNPRRKKEGNLLSIVGLVKTDTAVYQCNASNVHGYAFQDFYLNVLALPPTITERPQPVTQAVVTSTVILKCRVFGAPKPKVLWMRDSKELSGGRYSVLNNGDLEIVDLLVTDKGDYTCYASNKFDDVEATGKLEVKGKTKIMQPPENFEVAAGKSATFHCNADADPTLQLTIQWLFNGQPIDFDQEPRMVQAASNSLTITKTIELDSGVYTCIAKTELDEEQAQATLTVQDKPNPPRIVSITCDRLNALVEWQPTGDRRAPILSYTIRLNTSFTPENWEDAFVSIPAPDTKFTVSLSPWANYTFQVIARNKIGPSEPSGTSERCTTPEDVPHKNPENVVGKGTRPDNLVISWTPMPMIEQNAPGFFYKVFFKRQDIASSQFETRVITDWTQSQIAVENQETFKPYRIKVEAHNRKGQAHTAPPEIIGYSGEDKPDQSPKNFKRVSIRDAKSAVFSWDPVAPESVRGHFKGYKVQTWTPEEGEEQLREQVVAANVTQTLITIFKPFSRNIVRVLAFNEMYNGIPSDVIEFTTPEGVPGPVAFFDAIPMGSSAFYLIWKKPLEPNGILTGYRIFYREVIGTELSTLQERTPPITDYHETRAKLAGLKPNTKYRLYIYATTSMGQGEEYFIEPKTNEQAESPPDEPDFVWNHLPNEGNKAGVKVTWLPSVTGHPGSHFFVQYRKKGAPQWESTPMEENQDTVEVRGLDPGTLYEMQVVAVDGQHQTPSKKEELDTGGLTVAAPDIVDNVETAAWFIITMCALALLLLFLIIVCLIKRNRGGKYSVHEKEAAQGRELDYPDDGGFNEYNKPIDPQPVRGSRTSLNSSYKGPESETDSMADYAEGEGGKFGEDGSFIGQYGAKQKKKEQEATSPSALATFV